MTTLEKNLEYSSLVDQPDLKAVRLKVLNGLHKNAEFDLLEKSVLMIGSSVSCDIVLSDDSISRQHCLLHCVGSNVWVRSIENEVKINENKLDIAEECLIFPCDIIGIGDTQLQLLSGGMDVNNNSDHFKDGSSSSRYLPVVGLLVSIVILACFLVFQPNFTSAFAAQRDNADLNEYRSNEIQSIDRKVIDTTKSIENSSAKADQLAKDVEEILRLSGVSAKTRNIGNGEVEITGYFGDEKALENIMNSRSIQEINGLKKIIANNLDVPKADPININAVVQGDNPYIILKNGSRYYVGATLDNGYKLAAIEGNDVIFETSNGPKRVKGTDAWVLN